jgi:hypothetical protein
MPFPWSHRIAKCNVNVRRLALHSEDVDFVEEMLPHGLPSTVPIFVFGNLGNRGWCCCIEVNGEGSMHMHVYSNGYLHPGRDMTG